MQKLLTANSCPKHMVMGPCGGVRADGSCEVIPYPCVFDVPAEWADPAPPVPLPAAPRILADFSSASYSVPSLTSVAAALGPDAQLAMLRELGRVVRPDGRIGLLVYLATTGQLDDPPPGNHFPSRGQLNALLDGAHLEVLSVADAGDLPQPSAEWQDRTAAVGRELRRRFGNTAQLKAATEQSDRIAHLLSSGQLTSQVLVVC